MLKIKDDIDSRLPQGDMSGILLRECNWSVKTAGPSPDDNNRTELFLLGCKKAISGNPCKGCFNSTTWDNSRALWSHDPIRMAEHINKCAPNKYITIGGGEPTDQIENLIKLCKELKFYGFHIMLYTWRNLKQALLLDGPALGPLDDEATSFCDKLKCLLLYVDIVVDGEFMIDEKLWDGTKEDGLISSVGSGNQIIWDIPNKEGYAMRDIEHLHLTDNNELVYILKNRDSVCHTF